MSAQPQCTPERLDELIAMKHGTLALLACGLEVEKAVLVAAIRLADDTIWKGMSRINANGKLAPGEMAFARRVLSEVLRKCT